MTVLATAAHRIADVGKTHGFLVEVVPTEHGWLRNDSRSSRVLLGDLALQLPQRGPARPYTRLGWLRGMAVRAVVQARHVAKSANVRWMR